MPGWTGLVLEWTAKKLRLAAAGGTMKTYDKIYIGGEWVPSSGKGHFDVIDASTEEVMGKVPAGTPEDVSRAVERAVAAFPAWSETSPDERAGYLEKLQQGI